MAYCTLQQARRQLETGVTADDQILANLLFDASQSIDDHTGNWFEERYETHGFNGDLAWYKPLLYLDNFPLVSIDSFLNGDGTAIAAANYTLLPIGVYPKTHVRLAAGNYFVPPTSRYVLDAAFAIDALQVSGRWAWTRKGPSAWLDTGLTLSGAHATSVTTLTLSASAGAHFDVGSYLKIVNGAGAIEYLSVTGPVSASSVTANVTTFATTAPTVVRGEGGSTALAFAGGEKIYVYQVERTITWACAEIAAAAYKSRDNATGMAFNPGGFGEMTILDIPEKVYEKLQSPYWSFQRGKPRL